MSGRREMTEKSIIGAHSIASICLHVGILTENLIPGGLLSQGSASHHGFQNKNGLTWKIEGHPILGNLRCDFQQFLPESVGNLNPYNILQPCFLEVMMQIYFDFRWMGLLNFNSMLRRDIES